MVCLQLALGLVLLAAGGEALMRGAVSVAGRLPAADRADLWVRAGATLALIAVVVL